MNYFNKDATLTYLTLTEVGFDNYLVSEEDYYERLLLLRQFCDPADKDTIANIDLYIHDLNDWYGFDKHSEYNYPNNEEYNIQKSENGATENMDTFQGNDFDPILHFISAEKGKVSKWEFHKTDSDPVPSVPHGHAIINHKIKLDPYRGYIYKDNKQYDREKRQFIIDLWNDNKFREAARETIIYYDTYFPLHKWRVQNQFRLPRRRR